MANSAFRLAFDLHASRSRPLRHFLLGASFAQITGSPAADAIVRLNQPRGDSIIGNSADTGTGNFSLSAEAVRVDGGREISFTLNYDSIIPLSGPIDRPRTRCARVPTEGVCYLPVIASC